MSRLRPPINVEPLNAADDEMHDEANVNNEDNVDIFLNLHNIKDVEMSTNSDKRK